MPQYSWITTMPGARALPAGFASSPVTSPAADGNVTRSVISSSLGQRCITRLMSGPKGARGRRFDGALDPVAARLNASVDFDYRLLPHDVDGSIAHARMLASRGLISAADLAAIEAGL